METFYFSKFFFEMHISGNVQLVINNENHATLLGMEKVKSATKAHTRCAVAKESEKKRKSLD